MPNAFIKKVAKQSGEKKSKIEHEYKTVEKKAEKEGYKNPYKVAAGIVEKHHPSYHPKGKK